MKKKIVNLICNECGKLTTIPELVARLECFFCKSKNIETGWEMVKEDSPKP